MIPYPKTLYRDLSAYEGNEVRIGRWIHDFNEFRQPPAKATIKKNYENTVLFDLEFTACEWGVYMPPRHILKMISKAAMACGDIIVTDIETGTRLTGDEILIRTNRREKEEWITM